METSLNSELFQSDAGQDPLRVLQTESASNEYIKHLSLILDSVDSVDGKRVVTDYGIAQITEKEDLKLASYFFVISNLKSFSPEARDFFTDVMVYCEDKMGPLKSTAFIREKYTKEIRPALT